MNFQTIFPTREEAEVLLATDPFLSVEAADLAYGTASAYRLADRIVVVISDDARTEYLSLPPDADLHTGLLYDLLESDDVDGVDRLLQRAAVRGIQSVPEASALSPAPFWVLKTQYLYGPREKTTLVAGPFGQFDEALSARMELRLSDIHPITRLTILGHGEYCRPYYSIVSA